MRSYPELGPEQESEPESEVEAAAARVLFAPLRQEQILEVLNRAGRVEVAQLAADLRVSTESIRKDLTALERQGLLTRVHGGAITPRPAGELTAEPPVNQRSTFASEKAAIARAALSHVPADGAIMLDAGSTTARLAALLPDEPLLVATSCLPVALVLAERPQIMVHTLGGVLRRPTLAGVGQVTLDAMAAVNVDVVFLSTNAVSLERGLTTPDEQEAMVKRSMLHAAPLRILLADHSKFGRRSVWRHARLADVDLVITDDGISSVDLDDLHRTGVSVEIAATAPRPDPLDGTMQAGLAKTHLRMEQAGNVAREPVTEGAARR